MPGAPGVAFTPGSLFYFHGWSAPSCIRRGSTRQPSPFAAPNSRSPPEFALFASRMILRDNRYRSLLLIAVRPRNSTIRCFLLYFSRTPALPFPMVAPVPAQIPNLRPRSPAAPLRRRSLPLLATHYPLSTLFLSALCFHILTNCFSRNPFILTTIRIAPVWGYKPPISLRTLCLRAAAFPDLVGVANPLFSGVCCLFSASLRSFLHSLPLFSIACSLFSQNTGGGVSRMQLRNTRGGGSMTRYRLSTVGCELRSASTFAAVVGGGGDSHAAEFVSVILAIEDAPLFAVLEDLFFLRSDALADFRVGFLFFFQ